MNTLNQFLWQKYEEFLPSLEHLSLTANLVGTVSVLHLITYLDEDLGFLRRELLPHIMQKSTTLYPILDQMVGLSNATASLHRDQVEITLSMRQLHEFYAELRATGILTKTLTNDLRQVLYELYAIINGHFLKEHELYLPILERELTDEQANMLLSQVKQIQHDQIPTH